MENFDSDLGVCWERLRKSVNANFAHKPELTPRMFHCALHNAKYIGPVFDDDILDVFAANIAYELLEAKEQKKQGASLSLTQVGLDEEQRIGR